MTKRLKFSRIQFSLPEIWNGFVNTGSNFKLKTKVVLVFFQEKHRSLKPEASNKIANFYVLIANLNALSRDSRFIVQDDKV